MVNIDHVVSLLAQLIDSDEPPGMAATVLSRLVVEGMMHATHNDMKRAVIVAEKMRIAISLLICEPLVAHTSKNVWGYGPGPDEERWSGVCETREEAIKEARAEFATKEDPVPVVYVVTGRVPSPLEFMPDVDDLLERMGERAGDEMGDVAEDFPDVSEDGKTELKHLLTDWANKNLDPVNFWISEGKAERIEPEEVVA